MTDSRILEAKKRREELMAASKRGDDVTVKRISDENRALNQTRTLNIPDVNAKRMTVTPARTLSTPVAQPQRTMNLQQAAPQQAPQQPISPMFQNSQQAFSQPSTVTQLIKEALNKRIAASKAGMQQPIQSALMAAQAGPDITKFPGYGNVGMSTLMDIQRTQNQGLVGRAEGLLNLQNAFGRQTEQELGQVGNIMKERGDYYTQQEEMKNQQAQRQFENDLNFAKLQADLPEGTEMQIGGKTLKGMKSAAADGEKVRAIADPSGGVIWYDDQGNITKRIDATGNLVMGGGGFSGGASIPSGTGGYSGKTGMRTDRNNNPIASKMYPQSVQLLQQAGLVPGRDFTLNGDSTAGVDSDGVATITYTNPDAGIKGSIALLKGGQLNSWYANPKYGGASKILNAISLLAGTRATSANAQQVFNNLPPEAQAQIVKEIYKHEGGSGSIFGEGGNNAQASNNAQGFQMPKKSIEQWRQEALDAGATSKGAEEYANKRFGEQNMSPNEAQAQAELYAQRMQDSQNIFDKLSKNYDFTKLDYIPQRAAPNTIFGVQTGGIGKSNEIKQQEQAERNFINATLRRESGAAIAPSEFESAAIQYFPMPGDPPEVVQQKIQNRKIAIAGIRLGAGPAFGALSQYSNGLQQQNNDPLGISSQNGGDPLGIF